MDYYDLPDNKVFLISAKGLVFNQQKQILLLKISDQDHDKKARLKWDIPGGLIEIEEDLEKCLIREIKEECNIKVEVKNLLAINNNWTKGFKFKNGNIKDARIFVLGFLCQYKGGTVKLSIEHEDYRWVNIDQINNYNLIPNARGLIEKALKLI